MDKVQEVKGVLQNQVLSKKLKEVKVSITNFKNINK